MTSLTCARVVGLLEQRAVGLSETERLLAESHLAECAGCREQAQVLEGARRVAAGGADVVLSPSARELVLKRAFEAAASPAKPRTPRVPAVFQLAAACVLLVSVAAAGYWFKHRSGGEVARQLDVVEAGKLSSSQGVLAAGAGVPPNLALVSQDAARFHVGNALVEAAPSTRVTWRAAADTLALEDGEVKVSVEHVPGRHFRVNAPGFVVDVVGTEFKVDRHGVHVTRGIVRILAPNGRDVLALLPAGGAWSAPVPNASESPQASARSAAVAAPADVPNDVDSGEANKARVAGLESVAQRLAMARRSLAAGHAGEAEKLVEAALGSHPGAREAAEGRTLLAECAVAQGNVARAIRLYLEVAKAFPGLPAGENALFAGARLSERNGAAAQARELFESYLQRYPSGRFRQEAERHLQKGSAPPG